MNSSRLVYSTEGGRTCPQCRKTLGRCRCSAEAAATVRGDGRVRVCRERGGRGGKTVTVVRGLALTDAQIAELGQQLRRACSSGGTVRDGVIEIQGDHVERVTAQLQLRGHATQRGRP